ncbi:unnamed protein product [Pleuronectes platessa]|uniref:Uncharacterized protein n=1 Tax=Pleuronectes platessa TaxID=8262 RepID=A0A9N7Y3J9_PLEPL|nr:unnamed protein product [Pleuronectes platessa]
MVCLTAASVSPPARGVNQLSSPSATEELCQVARGLCEKNFTSFNPRFLRMSEKYPESAHTRSLPRSPPLAHGASELGEIVVRRRLCRLDLNWPVLNSELQRTARVVIMEGEKWLTTADGEKVAVERRASHANGGLIVT